MSPNLNFPEITENARRQYMDAVSAFSAWEAAKGKAAQVRGGMFWKENGEVVT